MSDMMEAVGVAGGASDRRASPAARPPRRPRTTYSTTQGVHDDDPRVSIARAEGGDVELVSLRCTRAEAEQVHAYLKRMSWAPPRSLTRRRQLVEAVVSAANLIGAKLTSTEIAKLHEWAKSVQ